MDTRSQGILLSKSLNSLASVSGKFATINWRKLESINEPVWIDENEYFGHGRAG
jgi:hypothetical protein